MRIVKRCIICKRLIWFSKSRICKNSGCGEEAIRAFFLDRNPCSDFDRLVYGNSIIRINGGEDVSTKTR